MNVPPTPSSRDIWLTAAAGFCALLVGVNLGRFAYTPLIPALIKQGYLNTATAGYLGTLNFLGYIVGAFWAGQHRSSRRIDQAIRLHLVVSTASLFFCAWSQSFFWLAPWRFLSGFSGACIMVYSPAFILKKTPLAYRGRVSGIMFAGVGTGVIISGFLLPYLAVYGLHFSWLGATGLGMMATIFAWPFFSCPPSCRRSSIQSESMQPFTQPILLLALAYGLFAIGVIPHSLFLVEHVHQALALDTIKSGFFWSLFGLGSVIGPFVTGLLADRLNIQKMLAWGFIFCAISTIAIAFHHLMILFVLSSFLMGLLLPSVVTLTSARMLELVGSEHYPKFWGKLTLFFATFQAIGSYLMSYGLQHGLNYNTCFVMAHAAFLMGAMAIFNMKPSFTAIENTPP